MVTVCHGCTRVTVGGPHSRPCLRPQAGSVSLKVLVEAAMTNPAQLLSSSPWYLLPSQQVTLAFSFLLACFSPVG